MRKLLILPVLITLMLAGCSGGDPLQGVPSGPPQSGFTTTDVLLSAGMATIEPETSDTLSSAVDASRFGVAAFDRVYELETPAGTDFCFNIVARGSGNFGLTRLSLGHVMDQGAMPAVGIESLVAAGMTVEAPGLSNQGQLVDINGDGFARAIIRGRITAEQVLLVRAPTDGGEINIGVRLKIGNVSAINLAAGNTQGARPGATTVDIYSSDAWQFGLPAIAVSGDRYSVVTYDGDPGSSGYVNRRRRWLQMDTGTGTVTGGDAESHSPDSGFWRDQEIAALGNVLAVAYTGNGELRAEVSLDRGATFPISDVINPNSGWGTRLAQIAIAPDYTLGVLYWDSVQGPTGHRSRLMLMQATPTGLDPNFTPLGYTWAAPEVLHDTGTDATPLLMHFEYSQGGDIVIGYGYTTVTPLPGTWSVLTSAYFRCAVKLYGGVWTDKQLDSEDQVTPADPHVCVLGSGTGMEIFYAYEKSDGIYLLHSADAGATFQQVHHVAVEGALQPSVHARMKGAEKRVDLLYAAPDSLGMALHNVLWTDFPASTPTTYHLTQSTVSAGGTPPFGMPQGFSINTLAWFGYDAVLDGEDVVVVHHEMTYDAYEFFWATGWGSMWQGMPAAAPAGGAGFMGTPPPIVLLPGMTGTVPAPDPAHRNQLRVTVLD